MCVCVHVDVTVQLTVIIWEFFLIKKKFEKKLLL